MVSWDVERLIYGTGRLHDAASLRIHLSPDYVTVNVMASPFVGEGALRQWQHAMLSFT
jgi:hypothetical protein